MTFENTQLKKTPHFAVKFVEYTNIFQGSVQFVEFEPFEADESITGDILFCKALPANTADQCLYEMFLEVIDWPKCIAICSNGAKAMTEHKSGLVSILNCIIKLWQPRFKLLI